MPMHKRSIEPVNVSRSVVAKGITNELECVSNSTMSQIIFQLSSLSKLSEDIFAELHMETCQVFFRTCRIFKRVELLKQKIIQLNPIAEEVSLHDINQRLPFRSETKKDQEIVTTSTRPKAICDVYQCIDPAPPLYILNQYRDDGMDSLKFYTDPSYFFELWKRDMVKDAENQMKKQRHKVKRRSTKDSIQFAMSKTNKNEQNKSFKLSKMPDITKTGTSNYPKPISPEEGRMPPMQDGYLNHESQLSDELYMLSLARQESANRCNQQQQQEQLQNFWLQKLQMEQQMLLLQQQQQQQQPAYMNNRDDNSMELDQLHKYHNTHNISSDHEFPEIPSFLDPPPTNIGDHGDEYVPHSNINSSTPSYKLDRNNTRGVSDNLPPPPIPPLPNMESMFTTPAPPDHFHNVDPSPISPPLPSLNSPSQNVDMFNDSSYLPSPPKQIFAYSKAPAGEYNENRNVNEDQAFHFSPGVEDLLSRIEGTRQSISPQSDNMVVGGDHKQHSHHNTSVSRSPSNKKSPTSAATHHHSHTPTIHLSRNSSRRKSLEHILTPASSAPATKPSTTNDQSINSVNIITTNNTSNTSNLQYQHSIVRDSRSDLLSAIKKGIQLRKVEEHRLKSQQQNVKRRLDVQSIMEAAFELRRKVMEENDGDDDDDDEDNGGWSDEE